MRRDPFAEITSGLDRAWGLRPGSGRFDLQGGLDKSGGDWRSFARATVESRLSRSWGAYGAAELGYVWGERPELDAKVLAGIRAVW